MFVILVFKKIEEPHHTRTEAQKVIGPFETEKEANSATDEIKIDRSHTYEVMELTSLEENQVEDQVEEQVEASEVKRKKK